MSNCYDIEIKMNYFLDGTSYKEALKDKERLKDWYQDHISYFDNITFSQETFYQAKKEFYERED
jgi:hypothetical protein